VSQNVHPFAICTLPESAIFPLCGNPLLQRDRIKNGVYRPEHRCEPAKTVARFIRGRGLA